jgi:hypothetical protein
MLAKGPVSELVAQSLWDDFGSVRLDELAARGIVASVGDRLVEGPRMAEAKRPKERKPIPAWLKDAECWAECGTWSTPTTKMRTAGWDPASLAGPRATMWDSVGREYGVRYMLDANDVTRTSHDYRTGKSAEGFPQKLQPRDRAGMLLRLQVEDLAEGFDPRRYLAPAYGPDTGAPVVMLLADAAPVVIAGNGRLMALRRWGEGGASTWRPAVMGRWKNRKLGDKIAGRVRPIVRVVETVNGRPITMKAAEALAGASQVSPSAATTMVAGAISEARGLEIASPLDVGPWRWTTQLDARTWPEFTRTAWFKEYLRRLSRAQRAPATSASHGPGKVEGLLLGTLPADALPPEAAPPFSLDALAGALPALWALEQERADGNIAEDWSLIPFLPAAWTWVVRAGSRGASRAVALAEDERRQEQAFEDPAYTAHGVRPEGIALAVLLLRAAARRNPREAASELMAKVLEAAHRYPPTQASLIPAPPASGRLLKLAGVRWGGAEDNPGAALSLYGRLVTLELDPNDGPPARSTRAAASRAAAAWSLRSMQAVATRDGRIRLTMPDWFGLARRGGRTVAVDMEADGPRAEIAKVSGASSRPSKADRARGTVLPMVMPVEALHAPRGADGRRVRVLAVEYVSTSPRATRRRHRVSGRVYYYPETGAIVGLKATRS